MLPTFVIVKGIYGEPLKRVFMAAEKTEVVIGDPDRFREIKSGDHPIDFVSYDSVFNFEEDVYLQLLIEWQTSKGTNPELWTRLGQIQLRAESDSFSCRRACQG